MTNANDSRSPLRFAVGDRVRVVRKRHSWRGKTVVIERVISSVSSESIRDYIVREDTADPMVVKYFYDSDLAPVVVKKLNYWCSHCGKPIDIKTEDIHLEGEILCGKCYYKRTYPHGIDNNDIRRQALGLAPIADTEPLPFIRENNNHVIGGFLAAKGALKDSDPLPFELPVPDDSDTADKFREAFFDAMEGRLLTDSEIGSPEPDGD